MLYVKLTDTTEQPTANEHKAGLSENTFLAPARNNQTHLPMDSPGTGWKTGIRNRTERRNNAVIKAEVGQ